MRILLLVFLALVLTSSTCDKGSSALPRTSLSMEVRHHERTLGDVDVRVYLNYSQRPESEQIDDFDLNEFSSPTGQVNFRDLPLGNHWFVGIGYDPAIGEQVVGHLPLRFDRRMLQHDTIFFVGEEEYYRID